MPAPFHTLTIEELAAALDAFPFSRRINAVHLHHTRRPDQGQYRGHETLVAMWRAAIELNGWSDIAQHLTVAPDGTIWTGRNWNQPPASAAGNNGSRAVGPFMLSLVGDFDEGRDRFDGEQRQVALRVIALLQTRLDLAPETLRFHSHLSPRTCPGTALDYQQIVDELRSLRSSLPDSKGLPRAGVAESGPFRDDALAVRAKVEALGGALPARDDPADAEPDEDAIGGTEQHMSSARSGAADIAGADSVAARAGQDAARPSPEVLDALRPHVVNLNQGRFSGDGQLSTTPGDVDAIFEDYLVREIEGARTRQAPLRIVFYAHGGLTKESAGLRMAEKHVSWWKRNNVYPIYFIWETGLFETIGQILRRSQGAVRSATRDLFDYTTDPMIEDLVRALYAPRIWSGMKRSAELASAEEGGALYLARKLKEFCDAHREEVEIELHAVGHSAGSIFHAYFLPTALDLGVPTFRTTHFLAPAIRSDVFHQRLAGRLGQGNGVEHLSIFTLSNVRERADDCNRIYRKSLLYLVHHALEAEPRAPILGMEVCLRNDPRLKALFGLGPAKSEAGEVVWSTTPLDSGRSASRSIRHGDFDDDGPTMNSVARRVLGMDDAAPIAGFPADVGDARGFGSWNDQVDWPEETAFLFSTEPQAGPPAMLQPPPATPATSPTVIATQPMASASRRALFVGIDQYATAPLYGCVADALEWRETLTGLGFESVDLLLNGDATRAAILRALTTLVTTSRAGDVLVFQFAGHGTQLQDASGDEAGGDTPAQDEAICSYDYADGAFVTDDDIGAVFDRIPEGVNLTCFIDCCHSGTISRFGIGAPTVGDAERQRPIPRFMVATQQMQAAHHEFRQRIGTRHVASSRGLSAMREVLFAACLSSEVAYENAGHGDFTVRATQLLRSGHHGLTNAQFEERVVTEFGASARQHPRLYCHPAAETLPLLQPLAAGRSDRPHTPSRSVSTPGLHVSERSAPTAQLLRLVASMVDERG